jgi:hypothetical protein
VMARVFTMVIAIPFLRLRDGTHPLAAGPVNPALLHRTGRSGRHAGGCQINLGPGRRIVSRTAREGVSRFAGQAGTQAPDPTPVLSQDQGSRAGSTIHILPAESACVNADYLVATVGAPTDQFCLSWLAGSLPGVSCPPPACLRHGERRVRRGPTRSFRRPSQARPRNPPADGRSPRMREVSVSGDLPRACRSGPAGRGSPAGRRWPRTGPACRSRGPRWRQPVR